MFEKKGEEVNLHEMVDAYQANHAYQPFSYKPRMIRT